MNNNTPLEQKDLSAKDVITTISRVWKRNSTFTSEGIETNILVKGISLAGMVSPVGTNILFLDLKEHYGRGMIDFIVGSDAEEAIRTIQEVNAMKFSQLFLNKIIFDKLKAIYGDKTFSLNLKIVSYNASKNKMIIRIDTDVEIKSFTGSNDQRRNVKVLMEENSKLLY